jgi:hypothetical protein
MESKAFCHGFFAGLVEGLNLPLSVLRARKEVFSLDGSGWWSTLLQGSVPAITQFQLEVSNKLNPIL